MPDTCAKGVRERWSVRRGRGVHTVESLTCVTSAGQERGRGGACAAPGAPAILLWLRQARRAHQLQKHMLWHTSQGPNLDVATTDINWCCSNSHGL